MTSQQQLALYEELHQKILVLAQKKGADYATDTDVLSNFKKVSSVIEQLEIDTTTPTGYALLMVVLKLCRIGNLLAKQKKSGSVAINEPVDDSFEDGINYLKLAYMCYKDEHK